MRYVVSKKFVKNLSKLKKANPEYEYRVGKTLKDYATDPTIHSLRVHKLQGTGEFSISVDMSIRILLCREGEKAYLLDRGKHEDVY